jgi:DNA replication protein DnaC
MTGLEMLYQRASRLRLWGMLAHWEEIASEPWVADLIAWSEEEQRRRSLAYRFSKAKLGEFKLMADFDWSWPKRIDRDLVTDLLRLEFLGEAANVVLVGPNGVGKSMIAQNLAHEALVRGHSVKFIEACDLLADLAGYEGRSHALERALNRYAQPHLLVIDEIGYLSYASQHADLLYRVINQRYKRRSTILTTNRPFAEWNEVFPNAACVVTLVDRLMHKAEIVKIEGDSYRAKESAERARRKRKPAATST